mmetsp:Transcript_918/g.2590  ORF Transcript_918/g.2590 Transcript_918/m.2590 type:complete len:258 (+) Transcript_918:433-1206(+)
MHVLRRGERDLDRLRLRGPRGGSGGGPHPVRVRPPQHLRRCLLELRGPHQRSSRAGDHVRQRGGALSEQPAEHSERRLVVRRRRHSTLACACDLHLVLHPGVGGASQERQGYGHAATGAHVADVEDQAGLGARGGEGLEEDAAGRERPWAGPASGQGHVVVPEGVPGQGRGHGGPPNEEREGGPPHLGAAEVRHAGDHHRPEHLGQGRQPGPGARRREDEAARGEPRGLRGGPAGAPGEQPRQGVQERHRHGLGASL